MRNSKTLLKMIIIVMIAASHAAKHYNNMHIGEILATEYCDEDDEEDEEEVFERMSIICRSQQNKKNRY